MLLLPKKKYLNLPSPLVNAAKSSMLVGFTALIRLHCFKPLVIAGIHLNMPTRFFPCIDQKSIKPDKHSNQ